MTAVEISVDKAQGSVDNIDVTTLSYNGNKIKLLNSGMNIHYLNVHDANRDKGEIFYQVKDSNGNFLELEENSDDNKTETSNWENVTAINAGEYTILYQVRNFDPDGNYTSSEWKDVGVTIYPKQLIFTEDTRPTNCATIYHFDGNPKQLVNLGTDKGNVSWRYQLYKNGTLIRDWCSGNEFISCYKQTEVGIYVIKCKLVSSDPNYGESSEIELTVEIAESSLTVTAPTGRGSIEYNGEYQMLLNVETNEDGTLKKVNNRYVLIASVEHGSFEFRFKSENESWFNDDEEGWISYEDAMKTDEGVIAKNVGKYKIQWRVVTEEVGYSGWICNDFIEVEITKREIKFADNGAPKPNTTEEGGNLVYNGGDQCLLKQGAQVSSIFEFQTRVIAYRLDDGDWVDNINNLQRADAGTYRVYYKAFAYSDSNYADSEEKYIDVRIWPATVNDVRINVIPLENLKFDGSEHELFEGNIVNR
ncbi:MAG: hypothetical protein J5598_00090, partial [Clostridia bacterium]|nr:hypothetical protein [Clostridia bacterium]